jgi:hypothetical protein
MYVTELFVLCAVALVVAGCIYMAGNMIFRSETNASN